MKDTESKKEVYSPFKVAFHQSKLETLRKGELPTPVMVQWDLTNRCNLKCNFCFYLINDLSDFYEEATMSTKIVRKTLRELKTMDVKAIEWTGGGSIECHPDYKQILRYSERLGFENALVTNGTLLDEESLRIIKDFKWVRFSIDSSCMKTYHLIKSSNLFHKAIDNLKRLLEIRNPNNVIGFSFIVTPDNFKEIISATLLAKKLGCDNIRFSLAMTPEREKLFEGIWSDVVKDIAIVKKMETQDFRVFAFSNRINELALKTLSSYCGYHHFVAVIAPTGIFPCCRLKDSRDYNFGSLNEESFKDIWFGEKRNQFIKQISDGCSMDCWMTQKNIFIEYLLNYKPRHVNFV
jgi:MoaA/NifB/PqqE/SkfB family radical SAM enzyme